MLPLKNKSISFCPGSRLVSTYADNQSCPHHQCFRRKSYFLNLFIYFGQTKLSRLKRSFFRFPAWQYVTSVLQNSLEPLLDPFDALQKDSFKECKKKKDGTMFHVQPSLLLQSHFALIEHVALHAACTPHLQTCLCLVLYNNEPFFFSFLIKTCRSGDKDRLSHHAEWRRGGEAADRRTGERDEGSHNQRHLHACSSAH